MISSTTTVPLDDDSVQSTLLHIKNLFFDSLSKGAHLLSEFDHSWSQFCGTVGTCADDLSDETRSMIFSFAETIAVIVPGLLAVENTGDRIRQQLQEEISHITGEGFSKLTIMHPQFEDSSYIKSAHAWLLDNLHNPYPPLEIRTRIARKHHCLRKNVDAWFIDARRRIGWNAIRRAYFPRKADLVTAATRFFEGGVTGSLPLKPSNNHDFEQCDLLFVDLMIRAKSLCSSNNTNHATTSSMRQCGVNAAALSYPSPEYSVNSSPEPPSPLFQQTSLLHADGSDQQKQTPTRSHCNKSPSSNHTILDDFNPDDQLPPTRNSPTVSSNQHYHKQLEIRPDSEHQPILQLPSPAPSANHSPAQVASLTLSHSDATSIHLSDAIATKSIHPSKRKRRLSDTGPENLAKRHCQQYPLQIVGFDPIVHPSNEVIHDDIAAYNFSQIPEPIRNIDFSDELFSIECMSYMLSPEEFPAFNLHSGPNTQPFASITDSLDIDLGFIPFADHLSGDHTGNPSNVESIWNLDFNLDSAPPPVTTYRPMLLDWTNFSQNLPELYQSPTVPAFGKSQAVICRQFAKREQIQDLYRFDVS